MKNSPVNFVINIILFSLVITTAGFILSKIFSSNLVQPHFYFIVIYFFLTTLIFYYGLVLSLKGRPQQFVRYFMGASTFKLLIHVAVVVIYSLFNRTNAMSFILTFFAVYLLFMIYEVRFALKLNRTTQA